ncbi:MAG: hypothetical protein K0Q79_549 [Flavipsychrobacter sp.]|jgi:hypothetical protein|nr:hypothetical protein [Flavipsychrobacter sp.]
MPKSFIYYTVYALLLCLPAFAQKVKEDYGLLKKANEEVILGFKLLNSNKTVLLCRQKENKYIVYRFGTNDNVELEYPAAPDTRSWKLFTYHGYSRGGGIANEAMEDYWISFKNNGVEYTIYEDWYIGDGSSHLGISIKDGKKEINLKAKLSSKTGTLGLLQAQESTIHNSAYD